MTLVLGLSFLVVSVSYLAWRFWKVERAYSLGLGAPLGLAFVLLALLLLWSGSVFLTPAFWTGYILLVDAAVLSIRGRSLLKDHPHALGWMAVLSIGLWLVFEAYNLRLRNWQYIGLPEGTAVRVLGYVWSFATIWPAVLETAELLLATGCGVERGRPVRVASRAAGAAGAALLVLPLLVPAATGSYLFGMVWLGFVFLLDPLNERAGRASLLGDLRAGYHGRLQSLLLAGLICGFVWEFWNYWAAAKWIYVFPIGQQTKIFEMPALGYLGFPAFAAEVFAMYVYASGVLGVPYYEVR